MIVLVTVLPLIAVIAVIATLSILCCLRKTHYTKLFAGGRLSTKSTHRGASVNGAPRTDSNSAAAWSAKGSNSVRLLNNDTRSFSVAGSGSGAPVVAPSSSTAAAVWCEPSIPVSSVQLYNPLLVASAAANFTAPACVPNLTPASAAMFPPGHLYSAATPMIYSACPPPPSYMCAAAPTHPLPTHQYFGHAPNMALGNGFNPAPDPSDSVDSVSAGGGTNSSHCMNNAPQIPLQTQSATSFEHQQQQPQRPHGRRHSKQPTARANLAALTVSAAGRAQSGSSERSAGNFSLLQQQQSSPSSSRQLGPPGAKSNSRISVSNNLPAAAYQFTMTAAPVPNANAHYPQAFVPLPIGQLPVLPPNTYQSPQQNCGLDVQQTSASDAYSSVDEYLQQRPARP